LISVLKTIKTKEFEKDKKELIKLIVSLDYLSIDKKLSEMIKFMQNNFKEYLKTKNKTNLNLASSYFRNLVPLLQDDFYKLLLKKYSKAKLITAFTKIDQGKKPVTHLEKSYKVIRHYIQKMDENSTINGKSLWNFDFKF